MDNHLETIFINYPHSDPRRLLGPIAHTDPGLAMIVTSASIATAACTACPVESASNPPVQAESPKMAQPPRDEAQETGVANVPFARAATFDSRDECLAHLERNAAIDLPYWREIRAGVTIGRRG